MSQIRIEKYILAHDVGTSSVKSSLVSERGEILRSCTGTYPTRQPVPGRAEQRPEDWWSAFCRNSRALTEGLAADSLAGISLTGQMMACLPVGAQGEALYPAMIWSDCRAAAEWAALAAGLGEERMYSLTGMRGSANYSLPKMMWFRKIFPEKYEKTAAFLSPKDYINFRLTGKFVIDEENAGYMYCFDRKNRRWSRDLLQTADLDVQKLPAAIPTGTVFGRVSAAVAEETGIPARTPVVMGIGDGGAATPGAGVLRPGEAYTSLGTSSWVCTAAESSAAPVYADGISLLSYLDAARLSGTMQSGGYALDWFGETFFPAEKTVLAREGKSLFLLLNELAAKSPPGADGLLFQPFLFGERSPLWDSALRASFLGLTARHTRGDMCRSVMESVAMHLGWILDNIGRSAGEIRSMRVIGGGANSSLWMQIFADVYGMPVSTVAKPGQAAALGLAVIAGTALGIFPDYDVIRHFQPAERTFEPRPAESALYREKQAIYREAAKLLQTLDHRLAALDAGGKQ